MVLFQYLWKVLMTLEKAMLFAFAIRDAEIALMKALEVKLPWKLNLTGDLAMFLCSFPDDDWISAGETKRINGRGNAHYPLKLLSKGGFLTFKVPEQDKRSTIYKLTASGLETKKLIGGILVNAFSSLNEMDTTEWATLLGEVRLRLDRFTL